MHFLLKDQRSKCVRGYMRCGLYEETCFLMPIYGVLFARP
jgi:hypothetical protein